MQKQDLSEERIRSAWWLGLSGLTLGLLLVLPSHVTGLEGTAFTASVWERWWCFFLALCVFLIYGRGFLLNQEGIHCCWYGIPYRHVKWESVKQIGIYYHYPNGSILVAVGNCPKYVPGKEKIWKYDYRASQSFHLIHIMDPKKNRSKIERFYGPLDYEEPRG